MLDTADYELVWPPELFAAEARRILARPQASDAAVDLLLREAFRDDSAAQDAAAASQVAALSPGLYAARWAGDVLAELANAVGQIGRASATRPYWPQRQGREAPGPSPDARRARLRFAELIDDLRIRGYLDEAFGRNCVDDPYPRHIDHAAEMERRLGIAGLWPLAPRKWDDDTFYGLIEVYHDLAARPRERQYHDFDRCGWHYSHFSVTAGREVYRWKVNELLASAGISYRLAGSGEDLGRLVAAFDDGRSALIDSSLAAAQPGAAGQVAHAVALFRSRAATPDYKRSAILALAGILEERRQLIKDELGRAAEGMLFQIANRFAIRHQNDGQLADYDPAFLDWIFWWYLATIELTDRIIRRQAGEDVGLPGG